MMCLHCLKFGELLPVNSRYDWTYLLTSGTTRPNTGVYSGISLDVLDQFLQSFHHIKAFYMRMMDLYVIFQFVKGRCHGNQIMLP